MTKQNILNTTSLTRALKLAHKQAIQGHTEAARDIYSDILQRFPKNLKAIQGTGLLQGARSSSKAVAADLLEIQTQRFDEIKLSKHPEGLTLLAEDPFVGAMDNVVSEEEANYIISKGVGQIKPAAVVLEDSIGISQDRTNNNFWLYYGLDDKVKAIGNRIAEIVGLPLENAEPMQVVHYTVGQEYRHHFDAFDLSTEKGQREAKRGGQRILTALVYLNKVDAGGGTDFKELKLTVEPKLGKMLVFHNTNENIKTPHPNSLHAGLPILEGEKWAFNIWFHQQKISEELEINKEYQLPKIIYV